MSKEHPFRRIAIHVDPALTPDKSATTIIVVGDCRVGGGQYLITDLTGCDFDRSKSGLLYWHPEEPVKLRPAEWGT